MASVNKVILVGNLGRDPETRTFQSGDMVANITIATTDRWKDKQTGEVQEATEWHRVSFHGRLAEIAGQYLRKGAQVYIEGSLRTRKWTDQAGVERYSTEIRADQLQMLGNRQLGDGGQGQGDDGYDRQPQRPQQSQQSRQQGQNRQQGQAYPQGREDRRAPPAQRQSSGFNDMDDDIPF